MNSADARKIADASGAPKDGPLYNKIGGAATDLAATDNAIRSLIRQIRSDLEGIERQLDRPVGGETNKPRLNDLGQLQSRGPAIDVAVSRYCAQQKALDALLHLASQLYPVTPSE
jgi:hypothetical protein